MGDDADLTTVTSEAELAALVAAPLPRVAHKVRQALEDHHRAWIARAPVCLVATADADGSCDVSPKGDPPGSVLVLDERTLVLPERPGNRRVDGFRNILVNPHVGLLFVVPGRGDSLRVNGGARLVRDAPWFDRLVVRGHRPALALVVDVREVFYHCSKAFLRSKLWEPASWDPDALPSRARLAHRESPEVPLADLERHYSPAEYERGLYAEGTGTAPSTHPANSS
ncbi:MAG: hypothetical protein JWM67_2791 [Mycobacterium sp.]|nr:hypothetical protein [Mycobacterium sp.]